MFYWSEPLGRRLMEWRCGSYEGSLELKKEENIAFGDSLFIRSFLDGRQMTIIFCESSSAIDRTVNVAELEKMDLEVTTSLKGW